MCIQKQTTDMLYLVLLSMNQIRLKQHSLFDFPQSRHFPTQVSCFWCVNTTRPVKGDGTVVYENGDRTSTRAYGSRCRCGYKHYWDGKEYDNLPEK